MGSIIGLILCTELIIRCSIPHPLFYLLPQIVFPRQCNVLNFGPDLALLDQMCVDQMSAKL